MFRGALSAGGCGPGAQVYLTRTSIYDKYFTAKTNTSQSLSCVLVDNEMHHTKALVITSMIHLCTKSGCR